MNGNMGMRGRWSLILGGGRSGKSALAERMAREHGGTEVLFVATAQGFDDEMRARIARHRADRASFGWRTLEAPVEPGRLLRDALTGREKVVLLDCLTLLISNVLCPLGESVPAAEAEARAVAVLEDLAAVMRNSPARWIVVSNEVGLGLVPPTPLGRTFRDALGRVNQKMAAMADEVLFMAAGLAIRMKG